MDKNSIDKQAEREANALKRQGRYFNPNYRRIRQAKDYNIDTFNKLFKDTK